jgi:hypothetical protein
MTRCLGAAIISGLVLIPAAAFAQRFYPDDPLPREPPPLPTLDPARRNLSALLEAVSATFGRPGQRQPDRGVIEAQGVNTLGEALDGPWYVNRHGRSRMSLDDLARGSGDAHAPSMAGPWQVLLAKSSGLRPALVFRDANNRLFVLRFDARDWPEMATAAGMISSRFFHALGYHVPESYLVFFDRNRLQIGDGADEITSNADVRPLRSEQVDRLLEGMNRQRDRTYRGLAVLVPGDDAALIGPYQLFGTRSDDPNDIVPHEHRRDLRGLAVFAAWLNDARLDALQTVDLVVQPEGQVPRIRHYLWDFMATLGSGLRGPKASWEGRERIYEQHDTLRNIASLGFYSPAWMRASYPDLRGVGHFDAKTFEPEEWQPVYDIAPFANRLPDDEFWAARQVMVFSDEEIRAIVQVGQLSDPRAAAWIAHCLIERRNRIGRTYFTKVLPLDAIAVSNGSLAFIDLAVQYGFASPRTYRVSWSRFDNATGKPSAAIGAAQSDLTIPREAAGTIGGYLRARITADGVNAGLAVDVYLRRESDGLRVVGVDREWPGRSVLDPFVVVRSVRNRYLEMDPAQQELFSTYVRTINQRTGVTRTAAERFRELSPSEQTSFDAITHALLHSALSDAQGRSLGKALDLVTSLERVAGAQTGRAGDEQFRLYVTLRPDAKDILDQSTEFFRDHENTVYHSGYPHSYRWGGGVPSLQFSVSADLLRADIDVDYRTSKIPQSLFNGHLTASNSDVRAGDNAQRHARRWNGFVNWWSTMFGPVRFEDLAGEEGQISYVVEPPRRTPEVLPPDRPAGASIPVLSDAVQEFLADWLIRRNFEEASAFFAPDAMGCVTDSMNLSANATSGQLRQATLRMLERAVNDWGRPTSLSEAMNPVVPWSPAVRIIAHAFERDFALVEAPNELGKAYACGAPAPPKRYEPSALPEYGTYYGAVLQVVRNGQPGGTLVIVWRRIAGEWRIVSYRGVQ